MPPFSTKNLKISTTAGVFLFLAIGACRGKKISQNERTLPAAKTQQLGGEGGEVVIDAPNDLRGLAGQLAIGEGAGLDNQAVGASVGVGTELSAAGPPVNVQSSTAVGASDYSRLNIEIPYKESGSLHLAEMFLVVAYAVKNENGETVVGIIPPVGDRPYSVINKRLRFALRGFGNYQAIRIAVDIKEEKSAVSNIVTAKSKEQVAALPALIIRDIKPIAAKRGETIKFSGDNLRTGLSALFSGIALTNIQILNAQTASAQLPAGAKIGAGELYLLQDGAEVRKTFLYAGSDGDLPIFTADASLLCTGTRFYDSNGAVKEGTKSCDKEATASTANCTSAGQQNCVATGAYFAGTACSANNILGCLTAGSFRSADWTNLTAANIKSGVSIAGVTGTVSESPTNCSSPGAQSCVATGAYFAGTVCNANSSACYLPNYVVATQPLKAISFDAISSGLGSIRSSLSIATLSGTLGDCSANNTLGCVTAGSYKSADWTNLTAANIRNGFVVAGLTGTYPSSGNLLAGSTGTADLDLATFDAKIKSAANFEWFGPDGIYYNYAGDADISAANISSSVTIFGLTGTLNGATSCTTTVQATCQGDSACTWSAGVCSVNTWNIRYGVSLNGSTGALKTNCKNRMTTSIFNSDSTPPGNVAINTGSVNNWWDTIEDYNNNLAFPTTLVTGFTAETDCSYTNWQDVTTDGTCDAAADDCMMKDRITGLIWSESYPATGVAPTNGTANWSAAVNKCDILTYGSRSDWRLPTQKELALAYIHGIRNVGYNGMGTVRGLGSTDNNDSFITDTDFPIFWSATTRSDGTTFAWQTYINDLSGSFMDKITAYSLMCVAP